MSIARTNGSEQTRQQIPAAASRLFAARGYAGTSTPAARKRARQICFSRGKVDGQGLEAWLQAERELKAGKDTSAF